MWADEGVYYPLEVEPYTPKHHFEGGTSDPRFRTKLKIAQQLVERSVEMGVPFRAVVADSFYGEDEGFRQALSGLGVGYVLALKESHSWWHEEGTIGALWEAAQAAGWKDADDPGRWRKAMRSFRDGHLEECCAFSFCWWAYGRLPTDDGERSAEHPEGDLPVSSWPQRKESKRALVSVLARGVEGGEGVAGTVGDAVALLEGVLRSAPAEGAKSAA